MNPTQTMNEKPKKSRLGELHDKFVGAGISTQISHLELIELVFGLEEFADECADLGAIHSSFWAYREVESVQKMIDARNS